MNEDKVLALFKFGEREHIEQFILTGHLYMNPISYFKKLEKDALRSDKNENSSYSIQATGGKLQVERDDSVEDVATINGALIFSSNEDNRNVFCMYALKESASKTLIDPRNFGFGDTFAILTDADEFLRRIRKKARAENIKIEQRLVEYVNKEIYSGKLDAFCKFSEFSYQSEFRIAIKNKTNKPISLRIGDISDISLIGPLHEVNNRIKILQ